MTREEIDRLWQRALMASVRDGEQFTRYHFAALVLEEAAKCCDERAHAGDAGALMAARAIRALKGAKE